MKYYAALSLRDKEYLEHYFSEYSNVHNYFVTIQKYFNTSIRRKIDKLHKSNDMPISSKSIDNRYYIANLYSELFIKNYMVELLTYIQDEKLPEERVDSYKTRLKYTKLILRHRIESDYDLPENDMWLLFWDMFIPKKGTRLFKIWSNKFKNRFLFRKI